MIRCQQMMLANTFERLSEAQKLQNLTTKDILTYFLDIPSKTLSIHRITDEGRLVMGKEPGDWFGVNSICQVIQSIFETNNKKPLLEKETIFQKLDFITF